MMKQKVEEFNATCKETMDCIVKQFDMEDVMNLTPNTLKLMQNAIKLVDTGMQVVQAETDMLNQIDKKLDDLNSILLNVTKIEL